MDKLIVGDLVEVLPERSEAPTDSYLDDVKPGMVGKVEQVFDFMPSSEYRIAVRLENRKWSEMFAEDELQLW